MIKLLVGLVFAFGIEPNAGQPLGEEHFYRIPLRSLNLTDGALPEKPYDWFRFSMWESNRALFPQARLDGAGEIYFSSNERMQYGGTFDQFFPDASIVVRTSQTQFTGRLFLPKTDWSSTYAVKFEVKNPGPEQESREAFFLGKEKHYRNLLGRRVPGGAWFRYQMNQAREAQGAKTTVNPRDEFNEENGTPWQHRNTLEESYDIFTGARALSENLQLDRAMPNAGDNGQYVSLKEIEGLKVKAFDWKAKIANINPALDNLASYIPEDQYAVLFPKFSSMADLIDEVDQTGTPIFQLLSSSAEDLHTKERYEQQLCLELNGLARLMGPEIVESVAMTGSDPFFLSGTDVALLFETKPGRASVLSGYLSAKQALAEKERGASAQKIQIGDFECAGVTTADRSICSFQMTVGDCVVITNSMVQLHKIAATAKKSAPSLAALDEYKFFRDRYAKGNEEETALLLVTDPAIRNWCSPKWRIGDSRRVRAAALLADQQAQNVRALFEGSSLEKSSKPKIRDDKFGTLQFMTPIAELDFQEVTKQEADFYKTWRDGYERNWSNFFDPIAVRFTAKKKQMAVDVTVMPLIANSEYRELISFSGNTQLDERSGDRHPEALMHWILALDPNSKPIKDISNFSMGFAPQLKNPFSWIGRSVSLYVDEDPMWKTFLNSKDPEEYVKQNGVQFPVALWVEVKDSLSLAGFLTAVRGMIEQTAPGLTSWESLKYKEQSYVKVTGNNPDADETEKGLREIAVYYVATPSALLITLNEGLLKRHLDRVVEKTNKPAENPWIGKSVALQARKEILPILRKITSEFDENLLRTRSWANLRILNEWKRLFPDQDPVAVHEKVWGVTLVCPGRGKYVWNEAWQTMESTVFGHPGEPKTGPQFSELLGNVELSNFGLTFEEQGIRARASITKSH